MRLKNLFPAQPVLDNQQIFSRFLTFKKSARFGVAIKDVKHAASLLIEAMKALLQKLNMAPGLVTEASLETSWLKVIHFYSIVHFSRCFINIFKYISPH